MYSVSNSLFKASKENADALAELASTRAALQKIYDAIVLISPKKTMPSIMEEKPLLPPVIHRSTPKVTPQQLQKRYAYIYVLTN